MQYQPKYQLAFNFVEIDKLILKFIWQYKGPRITGITLKKKNKAGECVLPDFNENNVILS